MSAIRSIPQMAMAASNSVCNNSNMYDTASSPPIPSAKKMGLPMPTALAPSADLTACKKNNK
jgi:hypothetical protein